MNALAQTSNRYHINPDMRLTVTSMGPEQVPLVVADNVLLDSGALGDDARQAVFQTDRRTLYPGVRASLPKGYVVALIDSLYRQIYDIFNIPKDKILRPIQACFSLITRQPDQLPPLQRIPHFDTTDDYFLAALHYLGAEPHGGTGFFQHEPTGYSRVTAQRERDYLEAAQRHFDQHGQPGDSYIKGSRDGYQLLHEVPYAANRLLIYPGNCLHSTLVNVARDIDAKPDTGRLTANIFLRFISRA